MTDKINELREYYDNTDTSAELEQATPEQPDTTAEPMVTYALRLPQPVLDGLREAAEARNVRVSTLMRDWLEQHLATETTSESRVVAVEDILALIAERGRTSGRQGAA